MDTDDVENAFVVELELAAVAAVLPGPCASDEMIDMVCHAAMVSGRTCLETIAKTGEFFLHGKQYRVEVVQ